jgi:hypothetical protein
MKWNIGKSPRSLTCPVNPGRARANKRDQPPR